MNRYIKTLSLVVAAVAGLYFPTVAVAQKGVGGVTGEARLHPGTWDHQRQPRSYARSRPMDRSTAPVIVRTEPIPSAVAQAPTERQSFSYEPSHQNVSGSGCGRGQSVATEEAPATAQRSTETRRSYSYEPATSDSFSAPSAPRMQMRSSRSSSRTPLYALPKTDPRKYSGR